MGGSREEMAAQRAVVREDQQKRKIHKHTQTIDPHSSQSLGYFILSITKLRRNTQRLRQKGSG